MEAMDREVAALEQSLEHPTAQLSRMETAVREETAQLRHQIIENGAEGLHHFQVGFLIVPSDIIGLAYFAFMKNGVNGFRVILYP